MTRQRGSVPARPVAAQSQARGPKHHPVGPAAPALPAGCRCRSGRQPCAQIGAPDPPSFSARRYRAGAGGGADAADVAVVRVFHAHGEPVVFLVPGCGLKQDRPRRPARWVCWRSPRTSPRRRGNRRPAPARPVPPTTRGLAHRSARPALGAAPRDRRVRRSATPTQTGPLDGAGYVGQAYPACRCCMYGS